MRVSVFCWCVYVHARMYVCARLMEEMMKVGISWAQYGVRLGRYSVALCFDLRFPTGFRPDMI